MANGRAMTRTPEQWADLARCVVRLADPADAPKIGLLCFEAERDGRNPAVWHNAAKFYGTRCHCAPCTTAR